MRETIAQYADTVGTVALIVMLCAMTIQYAAQGHAIKSAIVSPFAVLSLIIAAFYVYQKYNS